MNLKNKIRTVPRKENSAAPFLVLFIFMKLRLYFRAEGLWGDRVGVGKH